MGLPSIANNQKIFFANTRSSLTQRAPKACRTTRSVIRKEGVPDVRKGDVTGVRKVDVPGVREEDVPGAWDILNIILYRYVCMS